MKKQNEKQMKEKLLEQARYHARMLEDLTLIPCRVIPYYSGPDMKQCNKGCAFCEWIEQKSSPRIDCRRVGTEAGECALECGGRFVFYCKSGFIHFASPILYHGELIATLLGGPVQMRSKDGRLVESVIEGMSLDQDMRAEVIKRMIDIPMITPYKLGKAAEILAAVASHVARIGDALDGRNTLADDLNFWVLTDMELNLLKQIKEGNQEETRKKLLEYERKLAAYIHLDMEYGQDLGLTYVVMLARIYVDHHHSSYMDIESEFGREAVEAIQYAKTEDEIIHILHVFGEEFIHKVFLKEKIIHNSVINQVIEYINQNYMNKITLESTAENAFLSSSYLSKIFKEEVGCNFNTFVNKLRIEKAKKLLTDDNINIVEVANLVGYEDQSYFSKVFRRITGTTPKKYKDTRLFE